MVDVWSTVRTITIDGDSYRIYSHALDDNRWTWWSPALNIGGQIPWNIWKGEGVPIDACSGVIREFLHCDQGPA